MSGRVEPLLRWLPAALRSGAGVMRQVSSKAAPLSSQEMTISPTLVSAQRAPMNVHLKAHEKVWTATPLTAQEEERQFKDYCNTKMGNCGPHSDRGCVRSVRYTNWRFPPCDTEASCRR